MRAEILFPEVCNLYGDLQNVYYLRRCCPSLEIVETDLRSRPAPAHRSCGRTGF